MLKTLYIKNYALIDSLEMDFESGFSVITGETGAGKSIILGALGLILGQRADVKSIKHGESKCIIEGSFDVSAYDLTGFCEETGIEHASDLYILRREVLSTGKSRAFINDSPVSLTDLKELGSQLIDIHSQHQNLMLGDSRFQMQVVDILAKSGLDLKKYKEAYKAYKDADKDLSRLIELAIKGKNDEDYFRFQFDTLDQAKLVDGEQEELEQELKVLNNAEDIKSALYSVSQILSRDDSGVVSLLKEGLSKAQSLADLYSNADSIIERVNMAYIDLRDLGSETERYAEDVEFNPERLSFVNERLDQIYSLQQKHRVNSISELIQLYNDLEEKIKGIDSYDQQIEQARLECNRKEEEMLRLGDILSEKRKKTIPNIEKQLIAKVVGLGIPNVRFECKLTRKTTPDSFGLDDLVFLFSANKNMELQPVVEVASGGEISRVMLCLKSMIAGAAALPTILFDEIDTGVSGDIADRMGQVMQEFGQQMQVIAITHLPQIAAKGKIHYFVFKADQENTTVTNIRKLTDNERIQELAQMLSGSKITDAAVENAKVMLGIK